MDSVIYVTEFFLKLIDFDVIYSSGYGLVRRNNWYRWIAVIPLIIMNYKLTVSGISVWRELICYFFCIYIITYLCYQVTISRGVLIATFSIFVVGIVEAVAAKIIFTLFHTVGNQNETVARMVVYVCVTLLFVLGIRKIMKRMPGCLNYMKFTQGLYYIFVLAINLFAMVGLLNVIDLVDIRKAIRQRFLFAFIMIGFATLLQVTVLVYLSGYHYLAQEKELLVKEYLEQQNQHYHYLEKKEGELRRFQHDIRDHLGMLQLLSEQGRNLELKEYLEQICGKMNKLTSDIHTGNSVVDAILNYYVSLCQEKEIILSVKAHFPRETQIEEYDICTIFSNLLRNAVEAAQCSIEKEVNVEVWYDREAIYITIKNTFADKPVLDGKKWLSAKREYKHPGYGLFNIRECVDKYCGCFDYDIVDREFHAMVILYLEQRDLECEEKLRL